MTLGLSDAELLRCSNYFTSPLKKLCLSCLDLLLCACKKLSQGVAYLLH